MGMQCDNWDYGNGFDPKGSRPQEKADTAEGREETEKETKSQARQRRV